MPVRFRCLLDQRPFTRDRSKLCASVDTERFRVPRRDLIEGWRKDTKILECIQAVLGVFAICSGALVLLGVLKSALSRNRMVRFLMCSRFCRVFYQSVDWRCNQGYFVPSAGFGMIERIVRTLEKLSDCHPRHNIRNSEARRN